MPPEATDILAQLERILASQPFRTSKRCSDLLSYVVRAACNGERELLKERTLGVAVFGRDPEYDTNQDPVIRNTAGQVRKRLALYYLEPGHDRELRIELPVGAYVPQMYQPAVRISDAPAATLPSKTSKHRQILAISAAAILIGLLIFAVTTWRTSSSVELFWAPMLKQPGAVVLCVGQGHTYKLKGDEDRLFETDAPPLTGTIPLSDVVPIWDRSIGINDAQTLVRLAALFARFGHAVEFRGGRSTSLSDLRGRSTVLIGAFNNSWTMSLTGELRFYFDEDSMAKTYLVRDRLHPEQHAWQVRTGQPIDQDYEDYAIVSRVFDPITEQVVLVAAGIKGGGTAAAGDFLASADYLGRALQNAPRSWDKRNLQFVLKTRLLRGTAGPPELIATHFW